MSRLLVRGATIGSQFAGDVHRAMRLTNAMAAVFSAQGRLPDIAENGMSAASDELRSIPAAKRYLGHASSCRPLASRDWAHMTFGLPQLGASFEARSNCAIASSNFFRCRSASPHRSAASAKLGASRDARSKSDRALPELLTASSASPRSRYAKGRDGAK